jgi:hypothetical protein
MSNGVFTSSCLSCELRLMGLFRRPFFLPSNNRQLSPCNRYEMEWNGGEGGTEQERKIRTGGNSLKTNETVLRLTGCDQVKSHWIWKWHSIAIVQSDHDCFTIPPKLFTKDEDVATGLEKTSGFFCPSLSSDSGQSRK